MRPKKQGDCAKFTKKSSSPAKEQGGRARKRKKFVNFKE